MFADVFQIRYSLKFCNIGRKALVLELLFDNITGLQVWNFIKKRLQHWFFLKNIAKFLQTPILKNICECLLECLLNQKHNVGWFLQRRFVDVVRVYFLLIISRNHSNTFSLLVLQKNGSKVKYCSKGYLFWHNDFDRFRQVVVHYLISILLICN